MQLQKQIKKLNEYADCKECPMNFLCWCYKRNTYCIERVLLRKYCTIYNNIHKKYRVLQNG